MIRFLLTCSAAVIVAIRAAGAAGLSEPELAKANKLYLAKCAKCHRLYDPGKYSQEDWDMWMVKMTKKARLKPAQSETIRRYTEMLRQSAGTNASVVK